MISIGEVGLITIELLTIRLQVPNESEAFRIREHFLENALEIYIKTTEAMTDYKL